MSPPVVLSKQHARCSADLRLLAVRSAIEAREEGTGVEGSSACRQSVAAVANKQSASIIQRAHEARHVRALWWRSSSSWGENKGKALPRTVRIAGERLYMTLTYLPLVYK